MGASKLHNKAQCARFRRALSFVVNALSHLSTILPIAHFIGAVRKFYEFVDIVCESFMAHKSLGEKRFS